MVHLFVVSGYDPEKLLLTDKLLQAVLAEAQVKGISSGKFVDLALASSLGAGRKPDATCKIKLDGCVGSRGLGCPDALATSDACRVTDGWFSPHFSVAAEVCISRWTAEVSCPVPSQQVWPACWIDTPDRSSSSSTRAVPDAWDI